MIDYDQKWSSPEEHNIPLYEDADIKVYLHDVPYTSDPLLCIMHNHYAQISRDEMTFLRAQQLQGILDGLKTVQSNWKQCEMQIRNIVLPPEG
jgi:hypothetical protein